MNERPSTTAVVITGTPGTGKTSVSKLLAGQIGARYLSLNRVVSRKGLQGGIDQRRHTRIVNLKRTRMFFRRALLNDRGITVADTHIADALPREYVGRVIVLRCHPRILEMRLRRKKWRGSKVRENVLAEILDSCYATAVDYYGPKKVAQIDTSKLKPSRCVSQAKRILVKQPGQTKRVDWIRVLYREGVLGKYLR